MIASAAEPIRPPLAGLPRGRERLLWIAAILLVGFGLWQVLSSLAGTVRGWNDFAFVYASGRSWIEGQSPYDVERWRQHWVAIQPSFLTGPPTAPYLYPPHWAVFAAPLALLPWPTATRVWDFINLCALTGVLVLSLRLLGSRLAELGPRAWIAVGLALLNGAVRWSVWESQMSIVPLLGVVGAFWATRERRTGWLVGFAFLASLKPQIGLPPLAFLLVTGGHVGVLLAAGLAIGVSALALAPVPWAALPAQLAQCAELHLRIDYNQPDQFYGVTALFAGLDPRGHLVQPAMPFVTLVAFGLGWFRRSRRTGDPSETLVDLTLVLALTGALMPLHGYDLVLYVPIFVLCATLRPLWAGAILTLCLLASRAPAIGARIGLHPLAPWLTLGIAVLVLLAVVHHQARRSTPA
jgi:hypothetical protein